ncbi:MAG: hypothetical protein KJZ93_08860 [Caldilineaceae bacterium]|nr:hypothetical protein [Caldilineaceae bacterium]
MGRTTNTVAPNGHPDAGKASILNELAGRILKGEQLTADGITGLLTPSIPQPNDQPDLPEQPFAVLKPEEPAPPVILPPSPPADPVTHRQAWKEIIPEPWRRKRQAAGQLTFLDLFAA